MPADGVFPAARPPATLAIHATAVAIGGSALLIYGRSGSGKSRLAVALVAASTPRRRIVLIGDDRVLLARTASGLEARPHPRIAGFLERRGLGLVAMPWRAQAPVAGLAMLDDTEPADASLQRLPQLALVADAAVERRDAVLAWWHTAARTRQCGTMTGVPAFSDAEDWNW